MSRPDIKLDWGVWEPIPGQVEFDQKASSKLRRDLEFARKNRIPGYDALHAASVSAEISKHIKGLVKLGAFPEPEEALVDGEFTQVAIIRTDMQGAHITREGQIQFHGTTRLGDRDILSITTSAVPGPKDVSRMGERCIEAIETTLTKFVEGPGPKTGESR